MDGGWDVSNDTKCQLTDRSDMYEIYDTIRDTQARITRVGRLVPVEVVGGAVALSPSLVRLLPS